MATEIKNRTLIIKKNLLKNPTKFSFEMAVYILSINSKISFGKENSVFALPFKTENINCFYVRSGEISKIETHNKHHILYVQRLSIAGLNAPLPTPYAEMIQHKNNAKDRGILEFINIFNQRILGVSYQISKRKYLSLYQNNDKNLFLKSMKSFVGKNEITNNRLFSKSSLIYWMKEKNASGLESIIKLIFDLDVNVKQFKEFKYKKQENTLLGQQNIYLGINADLGKNISMSNYAIEIKITDNDYEKLDNFMNNKEFIDVFKRYIKQYIGDFIICVLKIKVQEAPRLALISNEQSISLGKNSWFHHRANKYDELSMNLIVD